MVGRLIDVKELQLLKVFERISVTPSGILIDDRLLQLLKAEPPIVVMSLGKSIVLN